MLTYFFQLIHPEDIDDVKAKLDAAVSSSGIFQAEFRIRRQDTGEYRWMNGYGRSTKTNPDQACAYRRCDLRYYKPQDT
jgi:hypothetical protein